MSFYEFAEHRLGITRGGNQYRRLRKQFNYWLRTAYTITNLGEDQIDSGGQFVVAEAWHVPWVDAEEWALHPDDRECWIKFSEMFVKKVVKENPVPVDFSVLRELNKNKSPLSLDIYLWLNRRMSYLRQPSLVTWEQLRGQFGSSAQTLKKFKQTFKGALAHVLDAWDGLDLTVSDANGITLFPSSTHVPTIAETRKRERDRELPDGHPRRVRGPSPQGNPMTRDSGRTSPDGERSSPARLCSTSAMRGTISKASPPPPKRNARSVCTTIATENSMVPWIWHDRLSVPPCSEVLKCCINY